MTTLTPRQSDVLDGIRERKMLRDIGTDLGLSKQYVSKIVAKLIEHGLVVQPRRGVFFTTDEPHEYGKRPVPVTAIRFTGDHSANRITDLWSGTARAIEDPETGEVTMLKVKTTEGEKDLHRGDWAVENGTDPRTFDVVPPADFDEQYEAVLDDDK